jgi:hypothetical protein
VDSIGDVIRKHYPWLAAMADKQREENMGRYATDAGGGDFQPAPSGTFAAHCIRLIDLGTHHGEYQGKPTARNQVFIEFELPTELMDDGRPYTVGRFFTNSLSEKSNLRPLLESWRGKAFTIEELMKFDLENILGAPALITIVHESKDGKTKAKIAGVAKLPKGFECPPKTVKPQAFWIEEWNSEIFDGLSDFFQDMIKKSDEYKERMTPQTPGTHPDPLDDDIPF